MWKLLAFCARYGRADLGTLLRLPLTTIRAFSTSIEDLLKEESELAEKDD